MSAAGSPIAVQWGSATDRGMKRAINEDSHVAEPPVFVVADGMGGHDAGEVASAIAVDAFRSLVGHDTVRVSEIEECFAGAQVRIAELALSTERSAGTTVSGLAIAEIEDLGYWLVFNLGDSRTYRMAHGALEQVSVDHSVVQELVEAGELDASGMQTHPQRNVITRALGAGSAGAPDFWLLPAATGDRMLVCSDGLTTELDDARIALVLRDEADPQAAATRLLHESLLHGGRDNLTVLVIDATAVSAGDDLDRTVPSDRLPLATAVSDDTVPRAIVTREIVTREIVAAPFVAGTPDTEGARP
ncbi:MULTISPECIES: PP2C family serine/threonine-protein phosphatase [unclassified Rathayibacter]|uniref:PP2C family protein-serine/threonine phosphatase n=1 Tax=unclassified Rathayibacter TaxID=2609250 RepID=UPI000CE8248F|nr:MULTISPECIES: protein phosphatase 2C domain-containing protein [unclassified Rathayibacter]PPF50706.1 serine/threonine protein phosphatase [Rathayibacter sp. AY1A1]PPG98188.1 serine/threonine protein phosphatase [Rathayibacter sp. AY1G9]